MPLDNNVGRISTNTHTNEANTKPQANIKFKQNKKKTMQEHILNNKQCWNRFNNIKYWFKVKII